MFERRAAFANIAPGAGQFQSPGAFDAAILEDRILFGAVPLPGAAVGELPSEMAAHDSEVFGPDSVAAEGTADTSSFHCAVDEIDTSVGNDSGAGFTSMRAWRRFDPVMILEEAESRSRDGHSGLTRESSASRAHMIAISTGETSPPPAGETSK